MVRSDVDDGIIRSEMAWVPLAALSAQDDGKLTLSIGDMAEVHHERLLANVDDTPEGAIEETRALLVAVAVLAASDGGSTIDPKHLGSDDPTIWRRAAHVLIRLGLQRIGQHQEWLHDNWESLVQVG